MLLIPCARSQVGAMTPCVEASLALRMTTKVGPRLTVPSLLAISPHPPERGATVGCCTETPATVGRLKELDEAGEISARPSPTFEADHEWTGRAGGTVCWTLLAVPSTGPPTKT